MNNNQLVIGVQKARNAILSPNRNGDVMTKRIARIDQFVVKNAVTKTDQFVVVAVKIVVTKTDQFVVLAVKIVVTKIDQFVVVAVKKTDQSVAVMMIVVTMIDKFVVMITVVMITVVMITVVMIEEIEVIEAIEAVTVAVCGEEHHKTNVEVVKFAGATVQLDRRVEIGAQQAQMLVQEIKKLNAVKNHQLKVFSEHLK